MKIQLDPKYEMRSEAEIRANYFEEKIERDKERPYLRVQKKVCSSCPSNGMYNEFVELLCSKPNEVRLEVSRKWFCHCNPSKVCAGNWQKQIKNGMVTTDGCGDGYGYGDGHGHGHGHGDGCGHGSGYGLLNNSL